MVAVRDALGISCSVTRNRGGNGYIGHRLQIGSRVLYDKLLALGLTPRKSLTLSALNVPDAWFRDFFRGVIDGDGNIRRWRHPTNGREQWHVQIYSASPPFLQWLQDTIERLWRVTGLLYVRPAVSAKHHPLYVLKFGKIAAKVLLTECYYPHALALERKRVLAIECIAAVVGWSRSKTVSDTSRWRHWRYTRIRYAHPLEHFASGVDPDAGLVGEPSIYSMRRGGETWRNALGLKPSGAKAPCGFESHPRQLSRYGIRREARQATGG